ncbi:MAG TPA: hypothetical protein VFF94_07635, partial [Novosphingobium sp.]|nr:hypothetical protein [Novosphingobium sp.]
MRSNFRLIAAALLLVNLTGCDKVSKYFAKEEPFRKEAPDLGGVKVVEVEAKGVGPTRSAAILDAINVALQQQNGTSMAALQLGSLAPDNQNIVALTQGSVQGFSVISEREGDAAHPWQIKLKVKVNSYQAPADAKLPKVVVAAPRTHQGSYVIGDQ